MYGFNQDTPEQQGSAPIPAGIQEDIKLTDVAYEASSKDGKETDKKVLAFYFEDKNGGTLRHCEWPIEPEEIKARAAKRGDDPDKAVMKKAEAQGIRIKHIVTKVIPAERAVVSATTFEQYGQAVVGLLKPHLPAGPFMLKVILNNKDYSSLPPYVPFIKKPDDDSVKLVLGKGERTTPKNNQELAMPGDSGGVPAGDAPDDDLPF